MNEKDTVLIVDDEEDICYFLRRNLSNKNYTTYFANSIQAGKQALIEHRPAILLLDNHLPDGRGIEFAEKVKQDFPGIKIVMITAHDTHTDRTNANKNGVDYFLSKPFVMADVYEALECVKKIAK